METIGSSPPPSGEQASVDKWLRAVAEAGVEFWEANASTGHNTSQIEEGNLDPWV